ncbi:MAG: anti-sigma factor antagonist [Candidatus Electrothrix sp. AU1_5]|nr:anti-sigma factor antagonist [Candidatus Electrothrix gigas]MCI5194311.1 anti-sigma factor antagonist [Candidatus Electrothrix gigas]
MRDIMKIEHLNNCTVVKYERIRLDAASAPDFIKIVCESMNKLPKPTQAIVLDLKGVEFADSSGLGAIVLIFQKLQTKLVLCGVGEQVEKLIKATRLDSIFRLYQNSSLAINAV